MGPGNDWLYGRKENDIVGGDKWGEYFLHGSEEERINNFNPADGNRKFGDCGTQWFS